ncbi:hypothetical protein NA57DRAFT_56330 [Rhizodiscina lignyota]|uniref:RING-type E3 ubiquitin transferase n=1 Tax=Rhizodiscina lignyota TaxID=1504668 RepID=A0A9P4M5Z7_9PEZI|nr:hypothetical protein NA57DRAFT_56330 [Rhizodiscina lignyota]
MASTSEVSIPPGAPVDPVHPNPSRGRGRGGHGAGRGAESSGNNSGQGERGRSRGGRGRGGGRSRGGFEHDYRGREAAHTRPSGGPGRQFGGQLTEQSANTNGRGLLKGQGVSGEAPAEEDVDAEVCFICASPVVHNAISPCNHRTCHICALRLRALYKTKACAHCRTNADYVIFTDSPDKRYEDFTNDDFTNTDDNLGIRYEKTDIFEDTVLLLRYNCPDPSCDVACLGWPDLHRHVKSVHHKVMCDLCTRNKKVFTHEHELFTQNELRKHERFGDDNPGAEDQTGFKGHPECGFCRERFYGDDELYAHCRDKHERCHICDRRDGGRSQQYYVDYNSLEVHFRKDHFLCPDQECLEKKFVVFENEVDLKAHQLEAHPNGLTKDARRDARRVDMSGFQFREQYQQDNRRGGRGGGGRGGRGRGRHPDSEPLPQSTAQPMRRDELAYQRTMAIQSAQSVSNRSFGGQLTPAETYAARPPAQAGSPPTVTATRSTATANEDGFPSLSSLNISNSTSAPSSPPQQAATLTPAEQARRLRHNAVTERASQLLRGDSAKLNQFRTRISDYKSSKITPSQLIDAFFTLFDTGSTELGKLVKELADIFELPKKKEDLLNAWNNWKAINEDYPSLPGPTGVPAGSSANPSSLGSGGMRVLKLKSSTAQSGRSGLGRQQSWGSAASSGSGGGTLNFPPLGAPIGAPAQPVTASRARPAWWANATSGSSNTADTKVVVSSRNSPATSGAPSRTATPRMNSSEAFPALPAAAKPTSTYFSPGYAGGAVRRDVGFGGAPRPNTGNVWGASGATANGSNATTGVEDAVEESVGGKKKGKQGKKQTLMKFG